MVSQDRASETFSTDLHMLLPNHDLTFHTPGRSHQRMKASHNMELPCTTCY